MLNTVRVLILFVLVVASAAAQKRDLSAQRERVSTTLAFLSSDELAGRDSPSRGLDRAQAWAIEQLRAAKVEPGLTGGSFEYGYEVPGWSIEVAGCKVAAFVGDARIDLVPGRDFRLLEASQAFTGTREVVARMTEAEAFAKGLTMRARIEHPVMVEVTAESELWLRGEKSEGLGRARSRGAPVLLVRKGVLPEGKLEAEIEIAEPKAVPVKLMNVVGMVKGSKLPDEFVLVTAHIDHIGVGLPRGENAEDRIYNGANDDASGCTAVLEIARLMAALPEKQRPARSMVFVLFSGEEKGLLGSKAMAANAPWPLASIVAQVNIEMIGRPEKGKTGEVWVTGRKESDFEEIAAAAMKRAGVKMGQFAMESRLYGASDNWPFVEKGVVAHSISASGIQGVDYHMTSDEFDRIDLDHMTKVVSGLAETVFDFADRAERPQRSKK